LDLDDREFDAVVSFVLSGVTGDDRLVFAG
jgi:hypothetical protein